MMVSMITVLRSSGLSVVIYRHDHEPPHVHVIGDGTAKIQLLGRNGLPQIVGVNGLKFGDLRKAIRAVTENQTMLLDLWRQIHG
jgi:hypothetical protein